MPFSHHTTIHKSLAQASQDKSSTNGLLQGLRKVAIDELAKVEGDLQREAKEDAELKERHKSAWRRPSSTALNAKFMEKVAGERAVCVCCVYRCQC